MDCVIKNYTTAPSKNFPKYPPDPLCSVGRAHVWYHLTKTGISVYARYAYSKKFLLDHFRSLILYVLDSLNFLSKLKFQNLNSCEHQFQFKPNTLCAIKIRALHSIVIKISLFNLGQTFLCLKLFHT